VTAIEDVDFLAPVKFFRDEPRDLTISARFTPDGDDIVAACRLFGERKLANQDEPQVTEHFRGRVRLATRGNGQRTVEPSQVPEVGVEPADIYRVYFHGPAYRVLDRAWSSDGGAVGLLAAELPPDHSSDAEAETDPRLVELCFQTAGLWEIATTGSMALPTHVDRIVPRTRARDTSGPVQALARPTDDGGFDVVVVDGDGDVMLEMEGYRTIRLPGTLEDSELAPLRRGMDVAD
jgi:hypothetical protein